MNLIIEFHEYGEKVAELPISAMASWTPKQVAAFGRIQELMGRTVMLKYEEENEYEKDKS